MTAIDEMIEANATYAAGFADGDLGTAPSRKVAVVACMDARLDVSALLGLRNGEAHVIRNAGGVVTDDVIRSLAISQRKLGTTEIALIHHDGCGMVTFSDDDFRAELESDTGLKPAWAVETFADPDADVRQSAERVRRSPFLPHVTSVRGFVYDVGTGALREV